MNIQIDNRQKCIKIDKRRIRRLSARLLKLIGCSPKELSITFVDDPAIRTINREYLGKDKPTNVISFSLLEGEYGNINPDVLGDVVISAETALRDAGAGHYCVDEEIVFLIIHGVLHLTGYNHENTTRANALKMKRKERELFRLLADAG
ncbi:MAG: rRNA maturation RNase YbeY [Syntrophaceae bacterium]|nr:rRNA maturation RNase YbeY [Syntrophaceae bacterium]